MEDTDTLSPFMTRWMNRTGAQRAEQDTADAAHTDPHTDDPRHDSAFYEDN